MDIDKDFKPKEIKKFVEAMDKDHLIRVIGYEIDNYGVRSIADVCEFPKDNWKASNRLQGVTGFIRRWIPENIKGIEIELVCENYEHVNFTGCPFHKEEGN